jgi:CTP synthase
MKHTTGQTRFIVVAGGVISGVGKGVATASIAKIVKEHGYTVTVIKIDPYINYDAGTLRPTEHGEVWVTADGGEIDQDLGTYERFVDQDIPKKNNITTGQIYQSVIDKERRGHYLGQTVQFMPHIIEEIKMRVVQASLGYDFAIVEIGGTVGDYENVPFLHALKSLEKEYGKDGVMYILVTYLPVPHHIQEMKTKPTQQAISLLGQHGIMPDFVICRSHESVDEVRRKKIEECCGITGDHIIDAPDVESIYLMPLAFEEQRFGQKILTHFNLCSRKEPSWDRWRSLVDIITKPSRRVSIAIVGKYHMAGEYSLADSYLSIYHALVHAAAHIGCGIDIAWFDARDFEHSPEKLDQLKKSGGVIVPGGFGQQGVEGKIKAIEYTRKNNIPYLGLCYGMQLAAVEYARNVLGLDDAHTAEVDPLSKNPVVVFLPTQLELLSENRYGGTMRLGSCPIEVYKGTRVYTIYQGVSSVVHGRDDTIVVTERHRHRYEINPEYVPALKEHGMVISGTYRVHDDLVLTEFIELSDHPFFVATQAHPEFQSRMSNPNPLFSAFIQVCSTRGQKSMQ